MKARISWVEGRTFTGESGSGHMIVLGRAETPDGGSKLISPMELVLMGAGGCTAFDVVHILEKGRDQFTGCVAEVEAERAETDPKVFTKIHIHFIVTGKGLDARKVERAIQLSAEKYCSATLMLGRTAAITHDFEVREV
jgi:putative redox protein